MEEKARIQVRILFFIRVILWIVALTATIWWMVYSVQLHKQGIFDPHEYATLLRPVLYSGFLIAVAAICLSFALHALTVRIKKKHGIKHIFR